MANYDYITINGTQIYRPVDFTPEIEDIYAAEIETMTGKKHKDKIGTRYSDITLSWDLLPESMVLALCNMNGACTIVFDDPTGDTITQTVVRKSVVSKRSRSTFNGESAWRGVSVTLEFMDAR